MFFLKFQMLKEQKDNKRKNIPSLKHIIPSLGQSILSVSGDHPSRNMLSHILPPFTTNSSIPYTLF